MAPAPGKRSARTALGQDPTGGRTRGSARNEDDEVASARTIGEVFDLTGEVEKVMPKATNSDRERVERAYKKTKLPQNFRNQDEIQDKMEAVADEHQRLLREMRENTLRIRKETLREFAKLHGERSSLIAQLKAANEYRSSHQAQVENLENELTRKKKDLQSKMNQMSINEETGNPGSSREMEELESKIEQLEKELMTEKSLVAEKNEEIARCNKDIADLNDVIAGKSADFEDLHGVHEAKQRDMENFLLESHAAWQIRESQYNRFATNAVKVLIDDTTDIFLERHEKEQLKKDARVGLNKPGPMGKLLSDIIARNGLAPGGAGYASVCEYQNNNQGAISQWIADRISRGLGPDQKDLCKQVSVVLKLMSNKSPLLIKDHATGSLPMPSPPSSPPPPPSSSSSSSSSSSA